MPPRLLPGLRAMFDSNLRWECRWSLPWLNLEGEAEQEQL